MSSVPLRDDILDDITYLQKHLRLIIKFHQVSYKLTQKLIEYRYQMTQNRTHLSILITAISLVDLFQCI